MKLTSFVRQIPTRIILLAITLMIAAHLAMLAYYAHEDRAKQHRAKRNAAIQKVMNIIHMTQATPDSELKTAVKTFKEPGLEATLSDKPVYDLQANVLTFWRINQLIPKDTPEITASLQLGQNSWLNIKADVTSDLLWSQLALISLELLLIVILIFYSWSISRFTNPLNHFRKAAEQLGIDVHSKPLEEFHGPAIVRETAQAMNRMQTRIQELLHDRTLILAAISHDLRTPITRMRLRADKIGDEQLKLKMIRDLNEMESMISEVLTFARNDYTSEKKVKFDLNSLLDSICYDMADVGFKVNYKSDSSRVLYTGRPTILRRAFSNLIQNAIKYGDRAYVNLLKSEDNLHITIEDDGPGIPETDLEKVFAPFYRCDPSRSRNIGGTGLGLTVAHDAFCAHSASIQLSNRNSGGLCVLVRL